MRQVVHKEHVDGFSKVWSYHGLSIPLEDAHKQFALDFCNVMFTSFFEQQAKMLAIKKAAEEKAKSLIVEA
jgi:hypothetical protein